MRVLRYAVVACVIGLPVGCAAFAPADYGDEPDVPLPQRDSVDETGAERPSPSPSQTPSPSPSPTPTPRPPVVPGTGPVIGGQGQGQPPPPAPPGPLRAFVSSTLVKGNS